MQRHQPLRDAFGVDPHVAHRGGAHADVLVPNVESRQVWHLGLAALPDRGANVRGTPLVQLLPPVQDDYAIVSGFNLADVQGQEHLKAGLLGVVRPLREKRSKTRD